MSPQSLAYVESLVKIIGVIIAVGSLVVTAYQARKNTKIRRAEFWLELRKMFWVHNWVHFKLRQYGEWHQSQEHPTRLEMPRVEAYMGLFEHCKRMLDEKLIDWDTFKYIYAYRVQNILDNPVIAKDLNDRKEFWEIFRQLVVRLGLKIPDAPPPDESLPKSDVVKPA